MTRHKHQAVYPLGATLFGVAMYAGTELGNSFDLLSRFNEETVGYGLELVDEVEPDPHNPLLAASKGVAAWTGLYCLARCASGRSAARSAVTFLGGFFATATLLGRTLRDHSSEEDVDFVVFAGLLGGGLAVVASRLVPKAHKKP